MRGGSLSVERYAAAVAVEQIGIFEAWYWERDSASLSVSSEAICLGRASTSDILLLILADDLTEITRKEFDAAWSSGAHCLVFLKEGVVRNPTAQSFVDEVRER